MNLTFRHLSTSSTLRCITRGTGGRGRAVTVSKYEMSEVTIEYNVLSLQSKPQSQAQMQSWGKSAGSSDHKLLSEQIAISLCYQVASNFFSSASESIRK